MSLVTSSKESSSSAKDHHGKKKDDGEVNLEEMLNELSREILKIYKTNLNPHADLNARNPLDLLTVSIKSLNIMDHNRK